jgi:hypothetical protein
MNLTSHILPLPPVGLHGNDLAIKEPFYMLLEDVKLGKYLRLAISDVDHLLSLLYTENFPLLKFLANLLYLV